MNFIDWDGIVHELDDALSSALLQTLLDGGFTLDIGARCHPMKHVKCFVSDTVSCLACIAIQKHTGESDVAPPTG